MSISFKQYFKTCDIVAFKEGFGRRLATTIEGQSVLKEIRAIEFK